MITASIGRTDLVSHLKRAAVRSSSAAADTRSFQTWNVFSYERCPVKSAVRCSRKFSSTCESEKSVSFPGLHFGSRLLVPVLRQSSRSQRSASSLSIMAAAAASAKQEAPFGAWKSPLTTDLVTSGSLRLGQAQISDDGKLIWKEGRPSEAG